MKVKTSMQDATYSESMEQDTVGPALSKRQNISRALAPVAPFAAAKRAVIEARFLLEITFTLPAFKFLAATAFCFASNFL